jgi:hypothetical protein
MVTVSRPDPLRSRRYVTRVSQVNRATGEVEDIFCSVPPFVERKRKMEVSSTNAARDVDSARGEGWFEEAVKRSDRGLRRAVALRATDIGGFLDAISEAGEGGIAAAQR